MDDGQDGPESDQIRLECITALQWSGHSSMGQWEWKEWNQNVLEANHRIPGKESRGKFGKRRGRKGKTFLIFADLSERTSNMIKESRKSTLTASFACLLSILTLNRME